MLNGATFAIYEGSSCTGTPLGTFTTQHQDYSDTLNSDNYNGIGLYYGIKAGTYCIKETVAPAGYKLDTTSHVVNVYADGGAYIYGIAIANTPQGLLPATGGIGTYIYMGIGALLVIGSIATIVIINKKKEKE